MARLKVFAHRTLIVGAAIGFFTAASGAAYQAAGAAVSLGAYAMPER